MSEKVSDDLDYDVPVFTSLGLKLPETISYDKKDDLNNIDIAEIYQKEPFNSDIGNSNISSFSKSSIILIILVFVIFVITTYYYYDYIRTMK
jgi:hypothetical protein